MTGVHQHNLLLGFYLCQETADIGSGNPSGMKLRRDAVQLCYIGRYQVILFIVFLIQCTVSCIIKHKHVFRFSTGDHRFETGGNVLFCSLFIINLNAVYALEYGFTFLVYLFYKRKSIWLRVVKVIGLIFILVYSHSQNV